MKTDQPGHGKKIGNNDMRMDPKQPTCGSPGVRAAMGQQVMADLFEHFEAEAKFAKRWHDWLGKISLVLLIAALEFGVFKLVAAVFGVGIPGWLFTGMLAVGIVPFVFTVVSYFAGFHEDWILARFKGERIRHWKFQQLLDGAYIESLAASPAGADHFSAKWHILLTELDGGDGHMLIYANDRPFRSPFNPRLYADDRVFHDALSIYHRYRLELQLNWFTQEKEHYQQSDKWTQSAASSLLFLGVVAAFAEGVLHIFPHQVVGDLEPFLSSAGIGLTLVSAGVRVYRNASGVSENAERYQRLASQLTWHCNNFVEHLGEASGEKPNQEKLLSIALEIERICHDELVEFVRVARKSDYIL